MAAPIDPSGFVMSVQLRVPGGPTYPLWINGAQVGNESIFRNENAQFLDLPIVQSVEVTLMQSGPITVNVQIGATYDLGLELLNSELFALGNFIEVQIGYPRQSSFLPWVSVMSVKPSVTIDPDNGLTATLVGNGGSFAASRGIPEREHFLGFSIEEILGQIADRDHNRWEVDLPVPLDGDDPLYDERDSVSVSGRSEMWTINELCRQARCDFFFAPDDDDSGQQVLRILRRSEALGSEPQAIFTSRGQIDMINRFPLFQFESLVDTVWLPRDVDVVTSDVRPTDNEEVSERVGPAEVNEETPATSDNTVGQGNVESEGTVSAARTSTPGRRIVSPVTDPSQTPRERAAQVAEEGQAGAGFRATITSIGIPRLRPEMVITLENLGVFSGNYMILQISHTAGEGEWTMTLHLLTNAPGRPGGGMITNALREPLRNVNDQEAQDKPDAGIVDPVRRTVDSIVGDDG